MMSRRMGRAVGLLACAAALLWPAASWSGASDSVDLVLRAVRTPTSSQLERSIEIITQRAQLLGGSGIQVARHGRDGIAVHIASISDASRARTLLASRGQLAFYDFEAHVHGRPARKPPATGVVLRCGGGTPFCPKVAGSPGKRWFYYAAKGRPEMTGADLVRAHTREDTDPNTGQPVVLMYFTDRGARAFRRITAAEAKRGKARWVHAGRPAATQPYFQHFAIVLDGRILSVPSIDFQQYPSGISGENGAQIVGLHGVAEARGLALLMKTGTLPVRFTVQR
jgi:SecD/SecF fusion protein